MKKVLFSVRLLSLALIFGFISGCGIIDNPFSAAKDPQIMYATAKSGLRGRVEPSTDGNRIVTYSYGTAIQILEKSSTPVTIDGVTDYWYKTKADVTVDGKFYDYSWVFGGYLSENSPFTGWPAAKLKNWGFPDLEQPAGVKSSYVEESSKTWSTLTIYMTGANAKTLQELKQQIEKRVGAKVNPDQPIMLWDGIGLQYLKLEGNLLEMKLAFAD